MAYKDGRIHQERLLAGDTLSMVSGNSTRFLYSVSSL